MWETRIVCFITMLVPYGEGPRGTPGLQPAPLRDAGAALAATRSVPCTMDSFSELRGLYQEGGSP
jgi:hypothetical protein